jgi:uncharacterized protein (TIGR03435 family)
VRLLPIVAASLMWAGVAPAQKFDVATIKPAAPGARGTIIRPMPGGRVNASNITLKDLIQIAYELQPFQISGGPPWLDSAHYDVEAKPDTPGNGGDWRPMLQTLLTERFQLTFHRETRELPMFALVQSRKDGKLAGGMTESKEGGCTPLDPAKPPPLPQPGKPVAPSCGNILLFRSTVGLRLDAASAPIARLAPTLSRLLGRPVVDETGVTGNFDMKMEWTPDGTEVAFMPSDTPKPPADAAGPSIFAALPEQLGLKLEPKKGPAEVFVIDHAEKPSEN